jgi:HAD superfamily phosphatase (TIGR01668 family)
MAFSLMPDGVYDSIHEIDAGALRQKGITLLLADLDNTIAPYSTALPDDRVRTWKTMLDRSGVALFILSNSRKPARTRIYAEALGVPFISHAGKPRSGSFRKAVSMMGRSPEQAAMVGDQIFTDVLGANRAGIPVLLVKPIRLAGNPGRYLRYAVELPFRMLAAGRRFETEIPRG